MPTARVVYDCAVHGYVAGDSTFFLDRTHATITVTTVSGECPLCGAVSPIMDCSARIDLLGRAVTELHRADSTPHRLPELRAAIRGEPPLRLVE